MRASLRLYIYSNCCTPEITLFSARVIFHTSITPYYRKDNEELKENSTEHYLVRELLCSASTCADIKTEIENFIVQGSQVKLSCLFDKFSTLPYGLTKSIISILLLDTLVKNKDILAIYEQGQFQLGLNPLMFDRMVYAPQNFELKRTVFEDTPILEEISMIVLPEKSKNILEITKGLINSIRKLEKYTLTSERLSKPTARFRNAILNAKDPIVCFVETFRKSYATNPSVIVMGLSQKYLTKR